MLSEAEKLGAWGFAGVLVTQIGQLFSGWLNHRTMTKQVKGVGDKADAAYEVANGINEKIAGIACAKAESTCL